MTNVAPLKRDWRTLLKLNKNEKVTPTLGNAVVLLTHDEWTGCLAYDEFSERVFWAKAPPLLPEMIAPAAGTDIADHHTAYVQHLLNHRHGVAFPDGLLDKAIDTAAHATRRHPLREYLLGLKWDGQERLNTWAVMYLGCKPSAYTASVGKWWMISAVARALDPGCQVDHMLILEGQQGSRKSTALRILAGEWYLPELPDVHSKDAALLLHGRWIVECGELDALRRSEQSAVKDFLTRTVDVYRRPYGKHVMRRLRSTVFAGTTNEAHYLQDPTGARRYWPLACTALDIAGLTAARDQLWAEAVARFDAGEPFYPSASMQPEIADQQEQRYQGDSWESRVLHWAGRQLVNFTLSEVLGSALDIVPERWTRQAETRVGAILARGRFISGREIVDGRRVRVYYARPRDESEQREPYGPV